MPEDKRKDERTNERKSEGLYLNNEARQKDG